MTGRNMRKMVSHSLFLAVCLNPADALSFIFPFGSNNQTAHALSFVPDDENDQDQDCNGQAHLADGCREDVQPKLHGRQKTVRPKDSITDLLRNSPGPCVLGLSRSPSCWLHVTHSKVNKSKSIFTMGSF
jgi:hypothetical protein